MIEQLKEIRTQLDNYMLFLDSLKKIFAAMDLKYKEIADYYNFSCKGCVDNCCLTRFYHHTLLEYLYIFEGFKTLGQEKQNIIKSKAAVCAKAIEDNATSRLMCPVNFDGLCILYEYRPMICRLHGIPHQFSTHIKGVIHGSGCNTFHKQCKPTTKILRLDRTPFYIEMAKTEQQLKQATGFDQKIKMTIAQMLIV